MSFLRPGSRIRHEELPEEDGGGWRLIDIETGICGEGRTRGDAAQELARALEVKSLEERGYDHRVVNGVNIFTDERGDDWLTLEEAERVAGRPLRSACEEK